MHRSSPGINGGRGSSRQRGLIGVSGKKKMEVQMPRSLAFSWKRKGAMEGMRGGEGPPLDPQDGVDQ